jgi:hypothetical protein
MNKHDHPNYPMTVGKLKRMLRGIPDSNENHLRLAGNIISRIKPRGQNMIQIEFELEEGKPMG